MGNAPLHDAALQGRMEIAQVLLEVGADVHAANNAGKTPLDLCPAARPWEHG
ncbi:MAG TPA: ankyrin repeat domain-containing protein [Synechococcus sp. UBA8638]|nr:ankyrin repeat domain-containing protein [Synechococcus sp. UBA8638]